MGDSQNARETKALTVAQSLNACCPSETHARATGWQPNDMMLEELLDRLLRRLGRHSAADDELRAWQMLTRRPMAHSRLTIDPRGEWSPAQARRVLAIINPQAKSHGIVFSAIDITTFGHTGTRLLLVAQCIEHEVSVDYDALCVECARSSHKHVSRA